MEKFWVKNYQPGVPEEINPDIYPSLCEQIEDAFAKYPNHEAFYNMGTTLTYSELEQRVHNFAAFLQNTFQMTKGRHFAIMMPNILQYPIAMMGVLLAGGTVVNVNPMYTPRELEHQLSDSQATGIIVLESFAHRLEQVIDKTNIRNVIVTKIGDELSTIKGPLVNFVIKYIKRRVPSWKIKNKYWYKDALTIGAKSKYMKIPTVGSDVAFLQYTGGTTGKAKGAILTHRNLVANVAQAGAWIKPKIIEGSEIIITALPLYHIFSLMANCLLFFSLGSKNILITDPRNTKAFVKELSKHKFTAITGVNTLFNSLIHFPAFSNVDFSELKITLGGGMSVHSSVAEAWHKLTGSVLLEAYGLTETSPGVCINPVNLEKYNGSIGYPIPSTEILIRDMDGNEVGIDKPGELCVRGPQVTQGYWMQQEETSNTITEDGWLSTGDIATIDEQGFVRIVDRKKDMILVSGFNVYPNEVEEVIDQLDGVLEVAVIGVTNPDSGESVKAFIVKESESITEQAIIAHCKKNLTAYKVPGFIEFRDSLPKSNIGKILRKELRE